MPDLQLLQHEPPRASEADEDRRHETGAEDCFGATRGGVAVVPAWCAG